MNRKRFTTVWFSPDVLEKVRKAAAGKRVKMSQYIEHVLSIHFKLVDLGLWHQVEALAEGGTIFAPTVNINIGTLIERLDRIEQLISANNAYIIKLKLTDREKSLLKEAIDVTLNYARVLSQKRPEEALTTLIVGLNSFEAIRKKILDAVKTAERRGLTLEDLANSNSQDAPLAKAAVEVLKFLELAISAARADRDKRDSMVNQVIAYARRLKNALN